MRAKRATFQKLIQNYFYVNVFKWKGLGYFSVFFFLAQTIDEEKYTATKSLCGKFSHVVVKITLTVINESTHGLVWLIGLFNPKSPESHKHKMNYMSYAPNPTSTPFAVDSAKREKNLLMNFKGFRVVANYSSWPVIIGVEQFQSSVAHP